ncbi:MAG: O-antigen five: acetylation of the O-antigen [Phycisphaerales bacterium]|nr:O-antigen five: acetylation of the O-antigen [Phycisphaerales bacterium]
MKPEAHLPPAEYAAEHPVLQNPGETRTLDHLPQLDGIRAIAVAMVIWSHFIPKQLSFRGDPPWGAIGVGMFFTLSGFLITRILLNSRTKIEDGRATFGFTFKQFYVRRFLRIFPLYYLVLIVVWLLNAGHFRERAWWSFAYLTNFRFGWYRVTGAHIETHLWSLSVEEQFYMIWPLLILICPRKLLLPAMMLAVAVAPYWRVKTYARDFRAHEWITPGCLDLLAMGAILALLSLPRYNLTWLRETFVQVCGAIGLPLLIAYVAQRWYPTVIAKGVPTGWGFDMMRWGGAIYPITAMTAVWFVGTAAKGFRGPIGWFLTCPPVVYIGRISYGLYVLHMFVPPTLGYFFPKVFDHKAALRHLDFGHVLGMDLSIRYSWIHLISYTAVAIAAASLSWFLLESPMNKLKRYFEYDKTAAAKAETSAAVA